MIVVKIAGSLDSFTIVLTKRISFCTFELNKNKKDMKAINAYAAYDAETPLKPLHLKEKSLVKRSSNRDTLQWRMPLRYTYSKRGLGTGHLSISSGHEIVGKVTAVGSAVSKFKVGEIAGVGCFVDSCRTCKSCKAGDEQLCDEGMTGTYNSYERGTKIPTYGGYSTSITADEEYTLHISDKLELSGVAPLLCAGITTSHYVV
jgi:uncharacterized zinc-type alcohol dehydrogenase-like protein